ncbi:MAG TPA: saccharopine dehydrogenase family protein [Alkalispirochaeta sp.]|nr:saccharopine dehydrogenase family protein [Alkalispirochaeta sp.]
MADIMIIGAGGVGNVVAHKCAQVPEVFSRITLASRTVAKCEAIAAEVKRRTGVTIATEPVDADNVAELTELLARTQPQLVINVALPYQDLSIMEACLATGVHYLDTANYEPPDTAHFEYSWQWAYRDRFHEAGLMALLGSGFDPGVTNVFTAYTAKHLLDTIEELDIVDVNGGDHGKPFATNFNPEINIREVTALCRHWEDGSFIETPAMSERREFTCPEGVGDYTIYRMYHEELESLVRNVPSIQRAQFWMSFSDSYLTHLEVLQNVGMTRIDPVAFHGRQIVPLQFLKAVLPEPSGLGESTQGRTCIGTIAAGPRHGTRRRVYVYNICDHAEAFREVGSQAVSYTTGVPAMVGAMMMITGAWMKPGVWNMEEFDPDPFMEALSHHGLPWSVQDPAEVTELG